ncbi:hypothetical protein ES703_114283 [subsurface metagenome]
MPNHFSVRDVVFTPTETGVKVVVETDVPCRLICRQTSTVPQIHKKPVLRRGEWLADDVRFCFVVYTDHEQEEPGDTLIHTFIKPDWPPCTTKWLYFWATIDGEVCVSTSAIFKYHNAWVAPPPVPTRFAWRRGFNRYGSVLYISDLLLFAQIFQTGDQPLTISKAYIYTGSTPDVLCTISIRLCDANDLPIGEDLAWATINLKDGVPHYVPPFYQHEAPLSFEFYPGLHWALVVKPYATAGYVWTHFRELLWEGPKDEGENWNISGKRSLDGGFTWNPIRDQLCFELFGLLS